MTEGEEADRPGGTGENKIKRFGRKPNSPSWQWQISLYLFMKVRETKFSKQEIRKMYRGFKQVSKQTEKQLTDMDMNMMNRSALMERWMRTLSKRSLRSFFLMAVSSSFPFPRLKSFFGILNSRPFFLYGSEVFAYLIPWNIFFWIRNSRIFTYGSELNSSSLESLTQGKLRIWQMHLYFLWISESTIGIQLHIYFIAPLRRRANNVMTLGWSLSVILISRPRNLFLRPDVTSYAHHVFKAFDLASSGSITFRVRYLLLIWMISGNPSDGKIIWHSSGLNHFPVHPLAWNRLWKT